MRELTIYNLMLIVDARNNDAMKEAHRVIQQANDALDKNDGGPTLFFVDAPIRAEYRENGEDDE